MIALLLAATIDALLRANAHPFRIADGKLSGNGAALIESASANVQFVAFGEEHNRRAVHQFAGAFFRYLSEQRGFQYVALEEDPYVGELLSKAARDGGREAVMRLAMRHPNAFHMYTEDEFAFIADAARRSTAPTDPIWGLNQVFGALHIFQRLVEIAPNDAARSVAQDLVAGAQPYEGERFAKNVHYMVGIAKPEDFERLRAAFAPKPGAEAEFLIDQAELSNRIFAPYAAKPAPSAEVFHQSGERREMNMKTLFANDYRKAQAAGVALPRVVVMLGQLHLYRGLSERTGLYTVGNFLSENAIFNGQKSMQLYVTVNADYERNGKHAPLASAALDVMGDADGVIIDLRPLFVTAAKEAIDPELRHLIESFDFFVLMRDATQGSYEHLKTPKFRWYPSQ